MAGHQVDGVFDINAVEELVLRIRGDFSRRAHDPLDGVDDVRERVLDGASAGGAVFVVDVPVSRAIQREVLPTDGSDVQGLAEFAAAPGVAHRGEDRMASHDVGDPRDELPLGDQSRQLVDSVGRRAEWLLDQEVRPCLGAGHGMRNVQVRRRADDGKFGLCGERFGQAGEAAIDFVLIGEAVANVGVDLAQRDVSAARPQEAAQVAFAD